MSWWPTDTHRAAAYQFNDQWNSFLRTNPNASQQEILDFMNVMKIRYGLQ